MQAIWMRTTIRYWSVFLLVIGATAHAQAPAQETASEPQNLAQTQPLASELNREMEFQIEPQPLPDAVFAFSDQSGIQIVTSGADVSDELSPGVSGLHRIEDALYRLLEGTNLQFVAVGASTVALTDAGPNGDTRTIVDEDGITQPWAGVEEIIVTGQKRAERLQDVPIAISAFSPEDLEAQKIEGGFDLLKGVPNVTFSKTNFSGYNFQIRGIGTQAVSATTDPGVAVSFNNTTLIVNRLFEQEYLDVERVEVLRGPQGTLFGRNATSGVINVISNKPELGVWDGMIDIEVGNYNTRRLRGFFNAPIGDQFAIRGAYASTVRDGYGFNEFDGSDVDNRDLWTGRLSLGWQPTDRFRANLIWERFEEDDNRVRTSKQLCHHDPAPETVGTADATELRPVFRAALSQGCLPGSLYDAGEPGLSQNDPAGAAHGAYGTPNGASLPFLQGLFFGPAFGAGFFNTGSLGPNPYVPQLTKPVPDPAPCPAKAEFNHLTPLNECQPDPYRGRGQSRDLRTISSVLEPQYEAEADIVEFSFDFELTEDLMLSSQTVYMRDEYFATQDFNRYQTFPMFNDANEACGIFEPFGPGTGFSVPDCTAAGEELFLDFGGGPMPTGSFDTGRGTFPGADVLAGGEFCDPQLGCSSTLVAQDISQSTSRQYNQEVRLVSSFDGDWNFSLGANFTRFRTSNDYFVFANALTALTHFFPFNFDGEQPSLCLREGTNCTYVDPKPLREVAEDPEGHNFFLSNNPYRLTSQALFGELYWNITPAVKLTAGLRMTWDQKVFTPVPSQLLLSDYRELPFITEGSGPEECTQVAGACELAGNASGGRGYPSDPDIVQEWREPTGRVVLDWKPILGFTDETMVYASFSRGYKGGGANPPTIAPPAGLINARNSGAAVPPTFDPEYINAYEIGTKNTLFGGALVLNGAAFYYDYTDYQVSKIVNRSAANENFDAEVWGLELETIFAPSLNWQFNAAIGYLNTKVASGEESLDLMDRTDGGNRHHDLPEGRSMTLPNPDFDPAEDPPEERFITYDSFDEWMVVKPWITNSSNCVMPKPLIEAIINSFDDPLSSIQLIQLCPGGGIGQSLGGDGEFTYGSGPDQFTVAYTGDDAPNMGQGFFKDLGGNELPNSPQFTVALGGQYNFDLTRDWRATARVDYYWQDESFARIYNTEYDRLKSWSNTNLSFWINNPVNGITVEAYVKNVFNEMPVTGTFLNSDDSGLTTNVFTLDPRLIGVSIRKEF